MKKTTLLLLLSSIITTSLFAKIDKPEENEIITTYLNKPFLEKNQENALSYIKTLHYKENYSLLNVLQSIFINSTNTNIQTEADNLIYKEDPNIEKNKLYLVKSNIEKLSQEPSYMLYDLKKNNSTTKLTLIKDKTSPVELKELVPLIELSILNGKNKQAQDLFFNYISKNIENKKDFSKSKHEEINLLLHDLYAHGAYLNYSNNETYKYYLKKSQFFFDSDNMSRFNYILYKDFESNELYTNAIFNLEKVYNVENKDYSIEKKLLNLYYKSSRKNLLDEKYADSWLSSKKGVQIFENFKLKDKSEKNLYNSMFIELKKQLKLSSMKYQEELLNKGESEQAFRIKSETLKLLGLNLL